MKANYKNWVPKGLIYTMFALLVVSGIVLADVLFLHAVFTGTTIRWVIGITAGIVFVISLYGSWWTVVAYRAFSYEGNRKLSKQIVEGLATYIELPDGGTCLDVGCGSGALTIACAKRHPQGKVVGLDRWGKDYASFSQPLCRQNAEAEGVHNAEFVRGDAVHLDFPDETFDAVTSNYVYHNISGKNKQDLLRETLRVLKKGGSFALHDIMSKGRFGDMDAFVEELKRQGYERVELVDTTNGLFMEPREAGLLHLKGSKILTGKK